MHCSDPTAMLNDKCLMFPLLGIERNNTIFENFKVEAFLPQTDYWPISAIEQAQTETTPSVKSAQVGTFSPNGTLGKCLPWTNCTAQGLAEEKPGTDTSDAICSTKSGLQSTNTLNFIPIMVIMIIISFLLLWMAFTTRQRNQEGDEETEEDRGKGSHLESHN
ncbi:tumor necrosis factor receptor superfamily member 5-like isoform X2 [Macrotis lagotis]|uniref:tumor necrosis factor receptor superfamily member 5-like isoform X2 n=1 Tax=Macrotis lagotis TaxID=92651 RepID=UPI003D68B2AA